MPSRRLYQWLQIDSTRTLWSCHSQGCDQHGEWLEKVEALEEWPTRHHSNHNWDEGDGHREHQNRSWYHEQSQRGDCRYILDPDEPLIGNDPIVTLKHLPAYILVKMARTRATQLEGLDEGVIPVQVATCNFQIKVQQVGGKYVKRSVCRCQFLMTLAYAFTDYRSQGQTIPFVMVDIATPPTGGLSLFNLYMALSRSSGRSTIRLLQDFDNTTFMQSHSASLLQEDDRLDKLDALTKSWWRIRGNHVQATWVVTFLEISVNYNELQKLLAPIKHHSDASFAC